MAIFIIVAFFVFDDVDERAAPLCVKVIFFPVYRYPGLFLFLPFAGMVIALVILPASACIGHFMSNKAFFAYLGVFLGGNFLPSRLGSADTLSVKMVYFAIFQDACSIFDG